MLFNSAIFIFAFLPITYGVFWLLRTAQSRYVWLTVTGYVFYGYWDARYCLLMLFSTLVSYLAGLGFLANADNPKARKWLLVLPITVDLLLLAFFKYADFGLQSGAALARLFGIDAHPPLLNIVLPIGISFYTFHTISYIVDAYRGTITPTRNFFEFSCYVSLFSQLVAGPIVRFRQIEDDLASIGRADQFRGLERGIYFFVFGLVEKVLIADTLASFVDPAFTQIGALSTASTWLVMMGYSLQLYFDFSGYSSMAVGLGLMFGIRIPQNFNSPYKALDPSDFWRRWHISLSTCMRDYLFIPLGGSRTTALLTMRNLLITMLIGGLWHGAAWTFVLWGLYHGLLLVAYRSASESWDRLPRLLRQGVMFVLALFGWTLFRSPDLATAGQVFRQLLVPVQGLALDSSALIVAAVAAALGIAMFGPNAFDADTGSTTWRRRLLVSAAAGASLALVFGDRASPFLYFQF